jgi:hypothetical protein
MTANGFELLSFTQINIHPKVSTLRSTAIIADSLYEVKYYSGSHPRAARHMFTLLRKAWTVTKIYSLKTVIETKDEIDAQATIYSRFSWMMAAVRGVNVWCFRGHP